MQVDHLDIHRSDAVVIAEVCHHILATTRRVEQRLRLASVRLVQKRLQH